ncbi:hypothetical protein GDO78_020579 [Eleutherodactylus coqui]|uniref:Uncharacterized protein n=1 Tax=Eleutherodactylus coqui TaxID=57060 RepID=A0A8J6EHP4_ELECQ|nr:hypothetical protein GDO78_020579 [Eleutherodactylus coqui]
MYAFSFQILACLHIFYYDIYESCWRAPNKSWFAAKFRRKSLILPLVFEETYPVIQIYFCLCVSCILQKGQSYIFQFFNQIFNNFACRYLFIPSIT